MSSSNRRFVNTQEFRREALGFIQNGYYTDAPPRTRDYYNYWDEQTRRCKEGYSVGGVRITGNHYFYLNFNQILLVPRNSQEENVVENRRRSAQKIESFPAFWDGDYEYFWAVEIARNGISREDYDALDLDVKILDLEGGRHLVVLKARGKGYSYKNGSMLARNYALGNKSKNYAIADETEYLLGGDGLLTKTWDTISFLDEHTAWKQPRLVDKNFIKRCGYLQRTSTGWVEKGRKNFITGVTLKNNPDKARGKRGDLILYEEAGKCPVLSQAWEINRPSVEEGAITTGLMIAFGTGGTDEADYESLEELFYHPDAYNVLPFENIWDEGGEGTLCSFFVPAYQNFEGFIDEDGNSDIEGAKAYHEEQREIKKKAKDNTALEQYISEHPFNPREATLQVNTNIFPTADLIAHRNQVQSHRRYRSMASGILYETKDGVKFRPKEDPPPIYKYPLRRGDDERGAICITEAPIHVGGEIPNDLYLLCHDPYAKDQSSESASLGATFVVKMWNNFSPTLNGSIVASYVGRPATLDEYNRNLFLLARYYNAKIAFENNRGTVVEYAKRFRLLQWLHYEPDILVTRDRRTRYSRSYGMTMNTERINTGEVYIRDWLNTPVMTDEEGEELKLLHTILDPALLQELIKYNRDGNFDRVKALIVGMYFMKEFDRKQVAPTQKNSALEEFLNRQIYA